MKILLLFLIHFNLMAMEAVENKDYNPRAISQLPDDVWHIILFKLDDLEDLHHFAITCKEAHNILFNNSKTQVHWWKKRLAKEFKKYFKGHDNLSHFEFHGIEITPNELYHMLKNVLQTQRNYPDTFNKENFKGALMMHRALLNDKKIWKLAQEIVTLNSSNEPKGYCCVEVLTFITGFIGICTFGGGCFFLGRDSPNPTIAYVLCPFGVGIVVILFAYNIYCVAKGIRPIKDFINRRNAGLIQKKEDQIKAMQSNIENCITEVYSQ